MIYLIIGTVCWWIAEGAFLIQPLKHILKINRLWVLDCPKCLAFWVGLFVGGFNPLQAVLSSAVAIFISKLYKF